MPQAANRLPKAMLQAREHSGEAKTGEMLTQVLAEPEPLPKPRRSSIDIKRFMPENVNVEIAKTYNLNPTVIGAGGFGKVVVGTDKVMPKRRVAIKKVIIPSSDPAAVANLRKEANTMKSLDHPNICKLFEYYETGNKVFFVMEYLEGGELFDRIMEQGDVTESLAAHVIRQAGSALGYAHTAKIAHRDMKPENIVFVDDDRDKNEIKIIDWGLSFHFRTARMTSGVGSQTYVAPEVLDRGLQSTYSEACDLWSLGVITYVMLTGKPPFWGRAENMLANMKRETFPLDGDNFVDISNKAKDFIRKLLRYKPEQRMSVADILRDPWIKDTLQGQGGRAPSTSSMVNVMNNLRHFTNKNHFYIVAMANVARNMDSHSVGKVHDVFKALDTNQDGMLSLEEMRGGFEQIYGAGSEVAVNIEELFSELDLDGSGTIDYTEFLAAGMGERVEQKEEILWAAFRQFDPSGQGKLRKDDISRALDSGSLSQQRGGAAYSLTAQGVMDRYDKNGDGSIDFKEFTRLIRDGASAEALLSVQEDGVEESYPERREHAPEIIYRGGAPVGVRRPPKSCWAGCKAMCTVQ